VALVCGDAELPTKPLPGSPTGALVSRRDSMTPSAQAERAPRSVKAVQRDIDCRNAASPP
jgi:hypothetical protein